MTNKKEKEKEETGKQPDGEPLHNPQESSTLDEGGEEGEEDESGSNPPGPGPTKPPGTP